MLAAEAVPAQARLNANAIKLAEDKFLHLAIAFFTRQFLPFLRGQLFLKTVAPQNNVSSVSLALSWRIKETVLLSKIVRQYYFPISSGGHQRRPAFNEVHNVQSTETAT
jgi:hypothetical protein